jgi:diketogulonate reductase-like aldo/keto reductase
MNISYDDHAENIAYVDNELTRDEMAAMEAARREHEEHPEGSISLEELKKINGITNDKLAKLPPLKIVYNLT